MSYAPDLCPQCNVNPRPKGCRACAECVAANIITRRIHFGKLAEAKRAAARAEKWKDAVCRCGCGVHVMPPSKYATDTCKNRFHNAKRAADLERTRLARLDAKAEVAIAPPPTPKKKKPIMTKAEQAAIDAAVQASYLKRSGMDTLKQVKVYTAEEAAAMLAQGKVTPLHLIPHRRFAGENLWSDYAGRGICG